MKTPREILLERHQAAVPKLDAIRHESVGQASRLSPFEKLKESETGKMPVLLLLWHELIWPSRQIWAGLAAVWVVILAANLSMPSPSLNVMAKSVPSSPEMMTAWRHQKQLLTELIGPNEPRALAPTRPQPPQPSSERRLEILTT